MRLLAFLTGSLLLGAAWPAQAMPAFAREYKQQYGYMPSCNACHTEGGGTALNGYGKAFKEAGKTAAAFAKIAAADSDGDGGANAAEAQAKANPGDKASTLKAPGNWLDMASLIPKEVQARFPGILTWMPRDAILTPADIAAAKAMGATLGAADENTIYVPVKDQRPAGTALIFPVTFQGKTGFLLMTTDRALKITGVSVLHADKLPAAKSSKVYASFNGLQAQAVPAPKGSDLDAAIATAVKNAGVLLYVRLKGA
ncbi:MAG TPA: hypothetical protein VFW49_14665 [Fluviicoccus sp.]|nr:hypothetical protein [Fluviicoccus sp.]